MSKFIDNILKEAEDSSDDFFQSKHVNKRREELKSYENKALAKLKNGLENIKIAYGNKDWKDEKEEAFLKLFSELHVNERHYDDFEYGYYILDKNNNDVCFYNLKNNIFSISFSSIWSVFRIGFVMKNRDVQLFMNNMLKKYFKLYKVTANESYLW